MALQRKDFESVGRRVQNPRGMNPTTPRQRAPKTWHERCKLRSGQEEKRSRRRGTGNTSPAPRKRSAMDIQEHWKIDVERSTLRFSLGHQLLGEIGGQFRCWGGRVSLDEATARKAAVRIWVELSSIDTGSRSRDDNILHRRSSSTSARSRPSSSTAIAWRSTIRIALRSWDGLAYITFGRRSPSPWTNTPWRSTPLGCPGLSARPERLSTGRRSACARHGASDTG